MCLLKKHAPILDDLYNEIVANTSVGSRVKTLAGFLGGVKSLAGLVFGPFPSNILCFRGCLASERHPEEHSNTKVTSKTQNMMVKRFKTKPT